MKRNIEVVFTVQGAEVYKTQASIDSKVLDQIKKNQGQSSRIVISTMGAPQNVKPKGKRGRKPASYYQDIVINLDQDEEIKVQSTIKIPNPSTKIQIRTGGNAKKQIEEDDASSPSLSEDEHASFSSDDSDSEMEILANLPQKRQFNAKGGDAQDQDLTRLTKRQRMALQTAQNSATANAFEIGRHNRDSLLQQVEDDNVLFALQNKKKNEKISIAGSVDDSDEVEEDEEVQLVKKGGRWAQKPHVNQSQIDEKKRQQLDQILDDIRMKYERKQQQKENAVDLSGLALFGKFYAQNQRYMNIQKVRTRPVQQMGSVVKTHYTPDTRVSVLFPPGILLPDCLRQPKIKESPVRSCFNCGKPGKKYQCPKTQKIACSYDCFQINSRV